MPYFGVGNESWGCGGNMRPEYYADEFRRYNTFVKNYDRAKPIYRIACGANGGNYNWTEVLMDAGRPPDERPVAALLHAADRQLEHEGLGHGVRRGPVVRDAQPHAARWTSCITKHAAIMDKTDPQKRVGLVVDEWGTWYDVEPGTEPGLPLPAEHAARRAGGRRSTSTSSTATPTAW